MKKLLLTLVALVAAMSMSAQVITVKKGGSVVATYTKIQADEFVYGNAAPTPEAVNLGLSVKWATFNVGATKPEENGAYFAWGEIIGYGNNPDDGHSFDWANYKWCSGQADYITKYATYGDKANVDNKTKLEAADDAATKNWGNPWRMPTETEYAELLNTANCTWEWVENYNNSGVNGYKITSKKSGYVGNFIFLPAVGSRNDSSVNSYNTLLRYWSSNLNNPGLNGARLLLYNSAESVQVKVADAYRYVGCPVRAVCP